MGRPWDWSPLASADPVPGDAAVVDEAARHYGQIADEIATQAARLRSLTAETGGGWDAEAGRTFRAHAGDLAGRLAKAQARYDAASRALADWSGHLESAQARADAALYDAKQAEREMNAHSGSALPTSGEPTDADRQAEADRVRAYNSAHDRLGEARHRLDRAIDGYHSAADSTARAIRAVADHDGLHDSFWDRVGGFIHHYAGFIKAALKVLGYAILAVAAVALIVGLIIPGWDVLDAALLAMMATSLLGHTALAATGDGNWFDIGMDLVGLATFGAGKAIGAAATEGAVAARGVAESTAATRGTEAAATSLSGRILSRLTVLDRLPFVGQMLRFQGRLDSLEAAAGANARQAVAAIDGLHPLLASVRAGSAEMAQQLDLVRTLSTVVPDVPELEQLTAHMLQLSRLSAVTAYGGNVVGGVHFLLDDLNDGYHRFFEEHFSHPMLSFAR